MDASFLDNNQAGIGLDPNVIAGLQNEVQVAQKKLVEAGSKMLLGQTAKSIATGDPQSPGVAPSPTAGLTYDSRNGSII